MKISGSQWLILIAIDFFLRALLSYGSTLNPVAIIIAIPISLLHLATFFVSYQLARFLKAPSKYDVFTVGLFENIAFSVVFVAYWIFSDRAHRVTSCGGPDVGCDVIEGVITEAGIRTIVIVTIAQIFINLIVVGIVAIHARHLAQVSRSGPEI